MKYSNMLTLRASGIALLFALGATGSQAQDTATTGGGGAVDDTVVVVTGIRGSLRSSLAIKRNANEVVDSITAEDIGKLPDPNVAETLTRIPGVQGYRYGGEGASPVGDGSGITIRGLSGQTSSQVDGRAYTTAGGREFNIEGAIPGMVAGVDVYKNPSAEHIEGGMGGLVNIRTRHPSDFKGQTFSLGVTARYNDLAHKTDPEFFGLYANKWDLSGGGRVGLMVAGVYQASTGRSDNNPGNGGAALRRAIRADDPEYALAATPSDKSYVGRSDVWYLADVPTAGPANTPNTAANSFAGTPLTASQIANIITAPTETTNVFQETIMRERKGFNVAADWVVNDNLRLYAETNYTYYLYHQNYRGLNPSDSRTVSGLKLADFDFTESLANRNINGGTDATLATKRLAGGTFLNSGLNTLGGDEHRPYQTWIAATGFEWKSDRWTLKGDFSYIKSDQTQDNRSVQLVAAINPLTGKPYTWDLTRVIDGAPHTLNISGPTLDNPNNWVFNNYGNGTNQAWDDNGYALAMDAGYRLDGFFNKIKFGARFAHTQDRYSNRSFGGKNLTTDGMGLAANQSNAISVGNAAYLDLVERAPTNFMNGDAGYAGGYLVFSPDALLGDNVRGRFPLAGIQPEEALTENIMARRVAAEDSLAGYVVGEFQGFGDKVRGNIGVRVVSTEATATAMINNTSVTPAAIMPRTDSSSYTNVLPSANLAYEFQPDTYLRLGFGTQITRAGFGNLNPTISVNTTDGTGSEGNTALRPQISQSYDLSFEKYFSKTDYVSLDVFDKEIDGFFNGIAECKSVPTAPAYSGAIVNSCPAGQYLVTRTVNSEKGYARGVELAGQTFFDYLPGFWSHFGGSVSVTYLDTLLPVNFGSATAPRIIDTPQAFQSKWNYSLIGMYEGERISARLVYTWRSESILFGLSANPIDGRAIGAYGILDASLNYKVNDLMTISFNGSNLTNKGLDRFVGEPDNFTGIERQHYVNGRTYSVSLRYKFGR